MPEAGFDGGNRVFPLNTHPWRPTANAAGAADEEATRPLSPNAPEPNATGKFRLMQFVTRPMHLQLAMPPGFRAAFFCLLLAACASGPPKTPYPAFLQADDLNDVFLANLPGVRAKQFSGDPQTRRTTNRIDLPPGWQGTSGGAPGKLLEIYVLAGKLRVGDVDLGPGGYAYLPPGTFGFNLVADDGARILYYLDDVDPLMMIRAPMILDGKLLPWTPTGIDGIDAKDLRSDPGNGARTWLLRIRPGAAMPWQSSSVIREGYLASGEYRDSECIAGEARTWTYTPGGYFYRPPDVLNGGPKAAAITESVWVLRERTAGSTQAAPNCG